MTGAPKNLPRAWARNWMTRPPEDYKNVVTFDFSPDELAILETRAEAAGLTVEGYMRACILTPEGNA